MSLENIVDQEFENIKKELPPKIDTSQFKELSLDELAEVLELTIKKDKLNKIVAFLCQLSAYTPDNQLNVSFNAPSSSGKTFIPLEIAKLFPDEDVIKLGGASPTAFFHEKGEYNTETNEIIVDLEGKIIIFLDQPNNGLLERLRPMFSHDQKEIIFKISDKNQKGGNRTKTVILKGYPAVIFCSAGFRIDEQEATRFILLSPEISKEKIEEAVHFKFAREADLEKFREALDSNPARQLLRQRILAIRDLSLKGIKIEDPEVLEAAFLMKHSKSLKPRHQRDASRIASLIKVLALLNFSFREIKAGYLYATQKDMDTAFSLWDQLYISQELNLSPYIFGLYQSLIVPLWEQNNSAASASLGVSIGVSREQVLKKHFAVHGRALDDYALRTQILPMLKTSGLIYEERDPNDKRKMLIYLSSDSDKDEDLKDIV